MKKFKIGLLCLAVSLVCFNLCSCGRGQNKLIEVGFEVNEGNGIALIQKKNLKNNWKFSMETDIQIVGPYFLFLKNKQLPLH